MIIYSLRRTLSPAAGALGTLLVGIGEAEAGRLRRLVLQSVPATKKNETHVTETRRNVERNLFGPTGKSSPSSRPDASLQSLAIRNRSYPTPQTGNPRLHIVSQSPACAVLVPSDLGENRQYCRNQIHMLSGMEAPRAGSKSNPGKGGPLTIQV